MRYRPPLLIALALTACAISVPTAAATEDGGVVVENPGDYEVESEVDMGIFVNTASGYVPAQQCDIHWDMSINAAGVGTVSAQGNFPHSNPASTGPCNVVGPCNNAAWPINLEESETGGFIAHVTFCMQNTGTGLSGATFDVECDVGESSNAVHCDEVLVSGVELKGELQVHGDLGVTHEIE